MYGEWIIIVIDVVVVGGCGDVVGMIVIVLVFFIGILIVLKD